MQTVLLLCGSIFLLVGVIITAVFLAVKMPLVACLIPLAFVVIGAVMLGSALKRKALEKKLRENGRKLWATVTSFSPNYSVTINGRHPYIIHCEYNGVPYQGDYSRPITEAIVGKTIPVYVSTEDPKNYLVDTSVLD